MFYVSFEKNWIFRGKITETSQVCIDPGFQYNVTLNAHYILFLHMFKLYFFSKQLFWIDPKILSELPFSQFETKYVCFVVLFNCLEGEKRVFDFLSNYSAL